MNKKNIVTKENISKVADFLKDACEHFKNQGEGCYNLPLSEDLVLAVGWSDGYDMKDTDIIKSEEGQRQSGDLTCGYAVNAAVKVRNDADCSDFDFLNYPSYKDGECWDNGITMKLNKTRREYRKDARWFLETFVAMTNAHKKGKLFMNKKEKTYTVVVHEVGKENQIREHVDQLSASFIPTEFEMTFPKEFANGTMWVELILEK